LPKAAGVSEGERPGCVRSSRSAEESVGDGRQDRARSVEEGKIMKIWRNNIVLKFHVAKKCLIRSVYQSHSQQIHTTRPDTKPGKATTMGSASPAVFSPNGRAQP